MEIEAKFELPDRETLRRLQESGQFWATGDAAAYALSGSSIQQVHDIYLDTPGRLILAAGYACRKRDQDGQLLITVKGLQAGQGAIHRREEYETKLSRDLPPQEWPAGPARDLLLRVTGGEPLVPLFDLRQTRVKRRVAQGERPVAELSLDEVRLLSGERSRSFFEAEVELVPEGNEDDLAVITACLRDEWKLRPQPLSKFERALAFAQGTGGGTPEDGKTAELGRALLTAEERAACERFAGLEGHFGRRARVLLALDVQAQQPDGAECAELAERRLRFWLATLHKQPVASPARAFEVQERASAAAPEQNSAAPEPDTTVTDEQAPQEAEEHKPDGSSKGRHPGLSANDPMAEAARKVLLFHLARMLEREPGTRQGEDIEELHDMRVATRRMRAAMRVFGDWLDPEAIKPFVKALRRTGRALGAVRDLDVFREKTQHYLDRLPPDRQGELEPLLVAWQAERDKARDRLLHLLDGDRYARFKQEFEQFLNTPGAGELPAFSGENEPVPHLVRHAAPVVLYTHLAEVRAFDEWMAGPDVPLARFHQLRIAFKGLRYTAEFFEEVLGPEAKEMIRDIKDMQDHLGDLQDAVVSCNVLRDFLMWGTWGHAEDQDQPAEPVIAPGVAAYLADRQTELEELVRTFPKAWARITDTKFSQKVADAVAVL